MRACLPACVRACVRACVSCHATSHARFPTGSPRSREDTRQRGDVRATALLAICEPNSALGSKTQRSLSALRRFAENSRVGGGGGGRENARRGRAMNHRVRRGRRHSVGWSRRGEACLLLHGGDAENKPAATLLIEHLPPAPPRPAPPSAIPPPPRFLPLPLAPPAPAWPVTSLVARRLRPRVVMNEFLRRRAAAVPEAA